MRRRRLFRFTAGDVLVTAALTLLVLTIVYPFYNAIVVSLISPAEYAMTSGLLYPHEPIFDSYLHLFRGKGLWNGYASSAMITGLGTVYGMSISTLAAYAFSRKNYPGKRLLFSLMLFTMFFGGGMIPTYLLIKNLGLINSRAAIILMMGVSPFNIIVMKTGFEQTPESLEEAARIDGANELTIFWRVMLPLQLPIIATFTLFTAVAYWNEWFWSTLIINSGSRIPLQVFLRGIVSSAALEGDISSSSVEERLFTQGVKMAAMVATMLPVMVIYPFLQRYFVKGVMIGAVKM